MTNAAASGSHFMQYTPFRRRSECNPHLACAPGSRSPGSSRTPDSPIPARRQQDRPIREDTPGNPWRVRHDHPEKPGQSRSSPPSRRIPSLAISMPGEGLFSSDHSRTNTPAGVPIACGYYSVHYQSCQCQALVESAPAPLHRAPNRQSCVFGQAAAWSQSAHGSNGRIGARRLRRATEIVCYGTTRGGDGARNAVFRDKNLWWPCRMAPALMRAIRVFRDNLTRPDR